MKAPNALAKLWRRLTARENEAHAEEEVIVTTEVSIVTTEVSEVQEEVIVTTEVSEVQETSIAITGDDQTMAKEEVEVAVSEAEIAAHWREEELYQPPPKFIGQANASDPAIYERFREENFPECFKEYADLLSW
jgi:hypothetical protein